MKTIKKRFIGNNENREKTSFENDEKTVCPRRGGERRVEVGSMNALVEKTYRKRIGNEKKAFVLTKDLPWLHFTLPPLPSARLLSPKMGGVEITKQLNR